MNRRKKFVLKIRQIFSKLLRKFGAPTLKEIVPEKHHKMLAYIERAKRKRMNK